MTPPDSEMRWFLLLLREALLVLCRGIERRYDLERRKG